MNFDHEPQPDHRTGGLEHLRPDRIRIGMVGVFSGDWAWTTNTDGASRIPVGFVGTLIDRWNGWAVFSCTRQVAEAVVADQQQQRAQFRQSLADQGVPDTARPESVVLDGPPRVVGRIRPRQAERWLRPLLHPRREPILGLAGPAAPYWTLSGDRPSLSLVAPGSRLLLYRVAAGAFCRFRWRDRVHQLPLTPTAAHRVPGRPRRLLVALTAPLDGYCHKVVAAVL